MDPVFHERLNYWSEAKNLDDLANRLGVAGSPVKDEAVARRVSDVIKTFLNSNEAQLVDTDLSRLRNLQALVSKLVVKHQDRDRTFATLEETIEKTITLVRSIDQVSRAFKSIEDAMSNPSAISSIEKASPEDVSSFVKSVRIAEKMDLDAFETLIPLFFRHANDRGQQHFFSHFGRGDERLLARIIPLLPRDISHFSAAGCILLEDDDVKRIVNRLNRLESLDFSHCSHVTDEAVNAVVTHPNMRNLKRLSFDNCILVSQEAQGRIEKMLQQK